MRDATRDIFFRARGGRSKHVRRELPELGICDPPERNRTSDRELRAKGLKDASTALYYGCCWNRQDFQPT